MIYNPLLDLCFYWKSDTQNKKLHTTEKNKNVNNS